MSISKSKTKCNVLMKQIAANFAEIQTEIENICNEFGKRNLDLQDKLADQKAKKKPKPVIEKPKPDDFTLEQSAAAMGEEEWLKQIKK